MLSILVASVVMFIIGGFCFTALFGKTWSHLMNFSPEHMLRARESGMTSKMIMMFVLNVISVAVISYLLPQLIATSTSQFVTAVFVVWIGFTLPSLVNTYLWEGKSWKLVAINAGGSLVAFVGGAVSVYLIR